MSNLCVFQFDSQEVRFVDGKPIANDVAKVLGYKNPANAIHRRVFSENKGLCNLQTPGGIQSVTVLEEAGIYQLIFSSKLETAQQFQQGVFNDVLPSIRKTGGYFDLPQDYLSALKALVSSEEEKLKLTAEKELYADKLDEAEEVLQGYRAIISDEVCLSAKQVADALNIPRLGRNNLIKYLREKQVILPEGTAPYRRALEAGWVIAETGSYLDRQGVPHPIVTTRLTFKGLSWLVKTLIKDEYPVNVTAVQIWDTYNPPAPPPDNVIYITG
jgi:prophage antirepressor-like protein